MNKIIDLNKTVYDLVQETPEVKDVLVSLGFSKITSPMALKVMGRVMTIPKGAAMMGIPMETIVRAFAAHGITVKGAASPCFPWMLRSLTNRKSTDSSRIRTGYSPALCPH